MLQFAEYISFSVENIIFHWAKFHPFEKIIYKRKLQIDAYQDFRSERFLAHVLKGSLQLLKLTVRVDFNTCIGLKILAETVPKCNLETLK